MTGLTAEIAVLVVVPAAAILLSTLYFLRLRIERPPVGVFTLRDIGVMMAVVVALPVLYLALPSFAVATILGLMVVFGVQLTLAPIMTGRLALGVAFSAAALELTFFFRAPDVATVLNNLLLLTLVVGVTNLYVQSGIKVRDVAVFGALLAVYDLVATVMLPTMSEFLRKTIELPFPPVFAAWGGPLPVMIGLGDVLMLTLWTLASLKGYGRAAGWLAACSGLVLTAALVAGIQSGLLTGLFPVTVLAGPFMAMQYLFWRRRRGAEQTMATYRGIATPSLAAVSAEAVDERLAEQLLSGSPLGRPAPVGYSG